MALDVALLILGLILASLTLRDVFDTVVVPGGSRASLKVAHRLVFVLLPGWKAVRGRKRGLSTNLHNRDRQGAGSAEAFDLESRPAQWWRDYASQ